jgi:hypothetical protein
MRSVILISRVGVVILLLCMAIGALLLTSPPVFFGLAFTVFLAVAGDLFVVYFRPDLSTIVPANKVWATIVSMSPVSSWNRKPGNLLVGGVLSGVLAIASLTRALGYW